MEIMARKKTQIVKNVAEEPKKRTRRAKAEPCANGEMTPHPAAGAVLEQDPQDGRIVYAGMWQFRRKPYFFTSGGPGSGLYKSTDGGKTWSAPAPGRSSWTSSTRLPSARRWRVTTW